MGEISLPRNVMLIVAVTSRYPEALSWSRQQLVNRYGATCLDSDVFEFDQTDYYSATMGDDLLKQFFAFEQTIDPADLPTIKHTTNQIEDEYRDRHNHPEPRPLNLDPGYISEAKLILASTKNHWHRIYLSQGIYAELTLHFQKKKWQALPWTYPDYRQSEFHAFFSDCRTRLRQIYAQHSDE